MNALRVARLAALPAALLSASCSTETASRSDSAAAAQRTRDTSAVAPVSTDVVDAVWEILEGTRPPAILRSHDWRHVRELYEAKGLAPLWIDGFKLRRRAEWLLSALANAPGAAIRLDAYPLAELRTALEPLRAAASGGPAPTVSQLADVEVLLSAIYVGGVEDVLVGQIDPKGVSQDWHINTREAGIDSVLWTAIDAPSLDSALAYLRPHHKDYLALMVELARYRKIVGAGGWPKQPAGKSLKPRDTTTVERLTPLVERLRAEGYLGADAAVATAPNVPGSPPRAVYDATIAGAVAAFQARHGLTPDSALGTGTRIVLDVSAEYRLQQIAANLERHRWLLRSLGDRFILVNVPSFELEAYDDGKLALKMRVIVGAEYQDRATPTFADSMAEVVFRPYWNVTPTIATNEVWPASRKDANYFAKNNYEIVEERDGPRIRQKPGPKNSLGLVKFLFPNDFNIYLHDTPADELFKRSQRALSHGCIRLEQPEALARFVLAPQEWDTTRVHDAMYIGKDDNHVRLAKKLPVYIVYFTTFVRDGVLHFGPDVYDRDEKLVRAVAPAAMPDAKVVAQAIEVRDLVRPLVATR
jgi:L,D-transpeptidase YcbB